VAAARQSGSLPPPATSGGGSVGKFVPRSPPAQRPAAGRHAVR